MPRRFAGPAPADALAALPNTAAVVGLAASAARESCQQSRWWLRIRNRGRPAAHASSACRQAMAGSSQPPLLCLNAMANLLAPTAHGSAVLAWHGPIPFPRHLCGLATAAYSRRPLNRQSTSQQSTTRLEHPQSAIRLHVQSCTQPENPRKPRPS